MTDARIVEQILSGNTSRYELLVEKYLPLVRSVCGSYEYNRESRDDLVQDSFIDGYLNLNRLRNPGRFAPWLAQIARNKSKNWVRSQKHQRNAHAQLAALSDTRAESTPLTSATRREMEDWIQTRIHELPVKTRSAMLLFYMEGHSIEEVARQLDVRVSAIKKRLQYGRELLGEKLCEDLRAQESADRASEEKNRIVAAIPLATAPWLKGSTAATVGAFGIKSLLSSWVALPAATLLLVVAAFTLPPLLETDLNSGTIEVADTLPPASSPATAPLNDPDNTDTVDVAASTPSNTDVATVDAAQNTGSLTVRVAYEANPNDPNTAGPPIPGATIRVTPIHMSIHPNLIAFVEENGFTDDEVRFMKEDGASLFTMAVQVNEGESAEEKLDAVARSKYSVPMVDLIQSIRARFDELQRSGVSLSDAEMMIVTYDDKKAQTGLADAQGAYTFASLTTGQYKVEAFDSEPTKETLGESMTEVTRDAHPEVLLRVRDTVSVPKGIVVDKDSGEPLEGVSVVIAGDIFESPTLTFTETTNEKGEFDFRIRLPFMKYGGFTLAIKDSEESAFYAPAISGVRELGKEQYIELPAGLNAVVYGRVLNADGTPAAGVSIMRETVTASSANGVGTSDAEGRYRAVHDGGIVSLYASRQTAQSPVSRLQLDRNESYEHDFILPPAATVYFNIKDESGFSPDTVRQLQISYTSRSGAKSSIGGIGLRKQVDDRFELGYLRPGEYTTSIYSVGYEPESTSFTVDDSMTEQTIELPLTKASLTATVRVVDQHGNPIKPFHVSVVEHQIEHPNSIRFSDSKFSNNEGPCLFENLWPGTFVFQSTMSGEKAVVVTLPQSEVITLVVDNHANGGHDAPQRLSIRMEDIELVSVEYMDRPLAKKDVGNYILSSTGRLRGGLTGAQCEPGANTLYCMKSGYTAGKAIIEVNPEGKRGTDEKVQVILGEGGSLFGTVTDEHGNGLAGEKLCVYPASVWNNLFRADSSIAYDFGRSLAQSAFSTPDGTFWIDFLPEDQYYVVAIRRMAELTNGQLHDTAWAGPFDVVPGLETGSVSLVIKQE